MSWLADKRYFFLGLLCVFVVAVLLFLPPLALRLIAPPPVPPASGEPSDLSTFILASEQNITQQLQTVVNIMFELIAFLVGISVLITVLSGKKADEADTKAENACKQAETAFARALTASNQVEAAIARLGRFQTQSQELQEGLSQVEERARNLKTESEQLKREFGASRSDLEMFSVQVMQYSIADSVRKISDPNCSAQQRKKELEQLGQMYNPAAIVVFQFVLEFERDPLLLYEAAHGLGVLGLLAHNPQTLRLLLENSRVQDTSVRKQCIESLGKIALAEDCEVTEQLRMVARDDPEPAISAMAKEALSWIGGRSRPKVGG